MNTVFLNIQKYYDDLSSTEQLIIDFILKFDDLQNIKLETIKQELHISSSTVIRAVKKLSYHSFTEFKYALINERKNENASKEEETFELVLENITTDFMTTIEMMDKNKLVEIATEILRSRRIFCIGVGSSASVVNSFNHKLNNYGLWSSDYSEIFPIRDILNVAKKEDCIVVFSLSGAEPEVVEAVTECKIKGCKIISITGLSSNPLSKISDINLMTYYSNKKRKKIRSRLMLFVAHEVIFETLILIDNQNKADTSIM